MKTINLKQIPLIWVCLSLYAFTLLFRIYYHQNHINFAQDQARDIMIVRELSEQGKFIVGYGSKASVSDFHWPPLYYQILMLVGKLTNFDPLASHRVFVFAEALTPVYLFLTFRFFARTRVALIVALIYAVSPTPTIYGTSSWNPNLIPLFTMISVYCWLGFYYFKKPASLIFGSFLPIWAFQLHFQAGLIMLFYFGFLLWVFVSARNKFKYVLVGWLMALLVYMPYIVAEEQNNWDNSRKIIEFFTGEHTRIYDRVSKPDFVLKYIPGFFERVVLNNNYPFYVFGLVLMVVGLSLLFYLSYKQKRQYLILLLLVLSLLIMVRVYKGDKLDYYLSAIFALPFLLLGLIIDKLKIKGLVIGLIIFVAAAQATLSIPHENGYNSMLAVIDFIKPYANEGIDVYFQEPDYTYPILYGLNQANIKISPEAKTGVIICKLDSTCIEPPQQEIQRKTLGPYQVVVSLRRLE